MHGVLGQTHGLWAMPTSPEFMLGMGQIARLGCGFPPHRVSLRNQPRFSSKVERKSEGESLERCEVRTTTQQLCQLKNNSAL